MHASRKQQHGRISKGTWGIVALTAFSWSLALVNAVFYVLVGETLSLVSFIFCAVMSTWSTYNTARCWSMDREGY